MTWPPLEYMAAWKRDPHGTLDCRHCGRELGNGHPPDCPIARLDFTEASGGE
jgi:hypothetical protein